MKKTYIVYKVTNKINGKLYIGKTYNLKKRKQEHFADMKNDNLPFHRAMLKYGVENFEWEIIDTASSDKEIQEKEVYWIRKLNTCIRFPNSNGYNITIGGEGGSGWNSKPVVQFDLKGNYIAEYISCAEASHITNSNEQGISECAKHTRYTCNNYMWLYKEDWNGKPIKPSSKISDKAISVVQLDLQGNYISKFKSVLEASKKTNTSRTGISACLNKRGSIANGFQWIYAKDYKQNKDYRYKGHKIGNGIVQLDDDFNIINHFNNCAEGARAVGKPTSFHKTIHKRLTDGKRGAGFYWLRYDDYKLRYGNTEITS